MIIAQRARGRQEVCRGADGEPPGTVPLCLHNNRGPCLRVHKSGPLDVPRGPRPPISTSADPAGTPREAFAAACVDVNLRAGLN